MKKARHGNTDSCFSREVSCKQAGSRSGRRDSGYHGDMKHSIRRKFTGIFAVLILALVVVMFIFYSYFLISYYRDRKIKQLEEAYVTIDDAVAAAHADGDSLLYILKKNYDRNAQDGEAVSLLRSLSERSNIDIIMMNSSGTIAAATSRESEWNLIKLKAYVSFSEVFGDNEEPFFPIFNEWQSEETREGRHRTADNTEANADSMDTDADAGSGSEEADAGISDAAGADGSLSDGSGADNSTEEDIAQADADAEMEEADSGEADSADGAKSLEDKQFPFIEVLKKTDSYTIQRFNDRRSSTAYLECWGQFSDGDTYFLMTMPIASMEEGVSISRVFLAGLSVAIIIIGAVAVYFTTGLVTRPIINLAGISEKISQLDFSAKYTGRSEDEIGILGNSMNSMSDKLEETINELKAANAKLQEDIDAKTKIDEMRKEFIADVSHELKTPIAIIEGYAEGLVEGVAEDKETRDYYSSIIMDEAGKMNRLVKQLTSLISYEFGEETADLTRFDISELIRSVLEAQNIRIEEAEANVSTELAEAAFVNADEFKIEEAFTNYLNNAINHLEGDRNIVIRLTSEDDSWRLSVYNDGTPIPEESIPKLWEKFYKVDKSRSREYGGSGIGLSIVKAIITSHGGSYGVENREHGVEFYFTLKKD